MTRPFVMNRRNPWGLPDAVIATLLTHTAMSIASIEQTPPRILLNVIEYLSGKRRYATKPAESLLETSIPPDAFAKLIGSRQRGR